MQELLHGTTMTATTTAPPTAAVSNCSQGGNGEQWGWGQKGEGWQRGRTNDREEDGRDDNDNSREVEMTTTDDEVEEKDKDGMRTGRYQAPPANNRRPSTCTRRCEQLLAGWTTGATHDTGCYHFPHSLSSEWGFSWFILVCFILISIYVLYVVVYTVYTIINGAAGDLWGNCGV